MAQHAHRSREEVIVALSGAQALPPEDLQARLGLLMELLRERPALLVLGRPPPHVVDVLEVKAVDVV